VPREITVARSAGQCFGVKRAFNIAMEAARSEDSVVMLGDIVHNEHVVKRIDEAGVKVVPDIEGVDKHGTLLVRAHGAAPEVYEKAREQGLKILDATCPLVTEIHHVARQMEAEGYRHRRPGRRCHRPGPPRGGRRASSRAPEQSRRRRAVDAEHRERPEDPLRIAAQGP
jgi:4-hydroxy-3-methylbut-2-enyl diphosphate reductase